VSWNRPGARLSINAAIAALAEPDRDGSHGHVVEGADRTPADSARIQSCNSGIVGATTFASRKMATGAPRSIRSRQRGFSALAFWCPYSLTGHGTLSAGTSLRLPSNTWLLERNST